MPGQSLSNIYFFCKAHHILLVQRSTSQHFSTILGEHFKQQIIIKNNHQKAQIYGKWGTEQTVMWTLVYSMRAESRRPSAIQFSTAGNARCWETQCFHVLCMPPTDHKSVRVLILVLQIYVYKWTNSQTQNLQTFKIDYTFYNI